MKRILILTANAGLGHRKAAEAIAKALHERHGGECEIEIANPLDDDRVPGLLRESQADYDRLIREAPNLYAFGYRASDAAVPALLVEGVLAIAMYAVMSDLLRDRRPDVVVTTYPFYQAPLGAVRMVQRLTVPLLTVVTDLVTVHHIWFAQATDLCLVPTEAAREAALQSGLEAERVKVVGIPVDPEIAHPEGDRAALRASLGWQADRVTLLVAGGKRVGRLDDILRVLNHAALPLQLAIVSGDDEQVYREYQQTEWHIPAHVYGFVDNMPALMRATDILMCKAGGLIVSEGLASGLPLLLVGVLPGQEAGNADYVVAGGAGELAADPIHVLETIYHWLDHGGALLAERARAARRLGRPHAAYEAAEQAWAAAEGRLNCERPDCAAERSAWTELLTRAGVLEPRTRQD